MLRSTKIELPKERFFYFCDVWAETGKSEDIEKFLIQQHNYYLNIFKECIFF